MERIEKVNCKRLPCELLVGDNVNENEKFSTLYINGLTYTNGNQKIWETDLYEHYIRGYTRYHTECNFFSTPNNGKILIGTNSLEELYIITKIFRSKGFKIKMKTYTYENSRPLIERFYIDSTNGYPKDFDAGYFELYVYIKCKNDYFKFRKLLLDLRNDRFYTTYNIENNKYVILN
jgi:hypothetical protein